MQVFLYISYLSLTCLFFKYYHFEKNTGLPIWVILFIFLCKVAAGTLNLYVHFYSLVKNDVGFYYWQSVNELKAMHKNPQAFFYEWLVNWGEWSSALRITSHEGYLFWKDLGVLLHTKFMTLANVLSLGNQYVNVIIYNIPFFIGHLYLYKTFYKLQPGKKWQYVVVIFLIPSVLFWCSGIHKDGWVLMAFGIIFYSLQQLVSNVKAKYIFTLLFGVLLLFAVRYFYLITLIPLICLWLYTRNKKYKIAYYGVALLVTLLSFFYIHKIIPSVNPMKMIQGRQQEFFGYIGYSDMKTPLLENNICSYVKNFPTAMEHILLRPGYASDYPLKYNLTAIDNYLILFFILGGIFFLRRKNFSNTFYISIFLYAFSIYLFIGYTIPNCGSLVRYKSEFTVLLLASLVGLSEVPFFRQREKRKVFTSP